MNKTTLSSALVSLLIAGNAEAHDHPGIDAVTHAFEHTVIDMQAWLPYLIGLSAVAVARAVIQIRRSRKGEQHRRAK